MNGMLVELVLDPAEPTHQWLSARLQDRLNSNENMRLTPWPAWQPGFSRLPGQQGEAPITLLLASARWLEGRPALSLRASRALVVAELLDGAARELGPGTALEAPATGEAASRFAVFAIDSASPVQLRCVAQVALPSLSRWRKHQRRCLLALADSLLWWLRLCEQRRELLRIAPHNQSLPLLPAVGVQLGLRLQSRRRWLQVGLSRHLRRWQQDSVAAWQIAIGVQEPNTQVVQILHHLPPQADDWFADPFLLAEEDRLWLFCERWRSYAGKGVIEVFEVRPEGLCSLGAVIEEPFHLSFPRVIRHNDNWLATVESADAAEVRLYRATSFPTQWQFERVLLSGEPWIDPILIPAEDGGWWLLVNSHNLPALPISTAAALHLFHSADLLQEPFEPHHRSPLLVDSTCGRNGGLLIINNSRARVSQCTGIDNAYGETVKINNIDALTSEKYIESHWRDDWPEKLKLTLKASHMHTINNATMHNTLNYFAIDFRPIQSKR
jgi:hypothetical protein